jgi:enterobacterial common antigen flippase
LPQDASAEEATVPKEHTYSQILKSTALIGGSTVVNIGIGIVRTKAMAVLLGPAGFGLLGVYISIADLVQSVASMGMASSGVRQIAEAVGSNKAERVARTTVVLRRVTILLGAVAALLLVAFSRQVSTLTFGSDKHATMVSLLSAAVFFSCVSGGQEALIQGTRRLLDLTKMRVLGALSGTIISIPMVYFLREDGLVPSLVAVAAISVITSWWYTRKVGIQPVSMTMSQMGSETAALLKLGFAFMVTGLMMTAATYAIRVILLQKIGFEAAGLYQSAWNLGGVYIGIILGSMGTDFYPRLTAVAEDHSACNRLVNEQAHVSLLLAGPGAIATLTLAPVILQLFYTPQFYEATEVLRWICLGMVLRIISWPMGFIIVAKSNVQNLFLLSEVAWTVVWVALAWICISVFGLKGAGIGFFASYIFHVIMIYLIVRRVTGFRWSDANRKTGLLMISLVALVFCGFYALSSTPAFTIGALAVLVSSVYSIVVLRNLIGPDNIPPAVLRVLAWFRLSGIYLK